MKPLKLTMQAFESYGKKTTIDFTKPNQNLFLVTGNTGAGKTTIFDAVVFALYGEASSGSNKKDGYELQSQFADIDTEPFVELIFSEKDGEETNEYTVRRIPAHFCRMKRKDGITKKSESVSLTMPDGSDYLEKLEGINKKLEEIVGLTKPQFMQVAMIAQGEFMELLRASSTDKKKIYRKLFHTEVYQEIVDELKRRCDEKDADIEQIYVECRTETGHVSIPENYDGAEEIRILKDRILFEGNAKSNAKSMTKDISAADMEELLEKLKILCEKLEADKNDVQKAYDEAGKVRDEKRDAYTSAQGLLKSFEQLEQAQKELAECDTAEEEIKNAQNLIREIQSAYDILSVYQRFLDAQKTTEATEKNLKAQQNMLPKLNSLYEEAGKSEEEAKKQQDLGIEAFTKVSEKVQKALVILDKIEKAKKDANTKEAEWKKADSDEKKAQKALEDLESREKEWRSQSEKLSNAKELLARWEVKKNEADGIGNDIANAKELQKEVNSQKKKADKAQQDYMQIREKFNNKNAEYIEKQTTFLDAQAGFIAKEKLREGKPCPVCGALEHPSPCVLLDEHNELTREYIDELKKESDELQREQEEKSAESNSAHTSLEEKTNNLGQEIDKLKKRMRLSMTDKISDITEDMTLAQADRLLISWKEAVEAEGAKLQEDADTFEKIQKSLKGIDNKKQALKAAALESSQKAAEAKDALTKSRTALEGLEADKDYPTKEAADEALKTAKTLKDEKDKAYSVASRTAKETKKNKDNAETLIEKYSKELPQQKEECAKRKAGYEKIMEERDLSEAEWKNVVEKYDKSDKEKLQIKVDAHRNKRATAEGMKESAQQAIDGRERPIIEELEQAKNKSEERFSVLQKELDECKEHYKANHNAYKVLAPKMEERSRIMEEHTRINSLYERLSGKIKGSRMDIETYVQRCYLDKILDASNDRFYDMSAGQFKLKMVDDAQAGDGGNKGLDLMVYSMVTGKEREIRTLSGGESFMAALSLALGMADQIQASSAAINLDIMFIDEGFGSLDEHSRGQAVRILKQMAGGSKLIGIISHVSELKQEIEDQLAVRKDEEGSYAKWQQG